MEHHATIGFAGHVDHGKTTLVRCLTGVDTDRKREEKLRGMSIEAGVAPVALPSGCRAAVIDVPGHTDFLKNAIRGLNGVDVGVLVIAADDGVMPQTREHLEILKFFNAHTGFVVLSKVDLVDEETLALAELEIRELVEGTFLDHQPVYRFSARQPDLSHVILEGIDKAVHALPAKKRDMPFRLWIDQVRSLPGHGTVVSGTVCTGNIQHNEAIELLPQGQKTRVRSLESHARSVDQAVAGQRVGLNLHRLSLDHVRRGMCLTTPGAFTATQMINADIRVLAAARIGIKNRQKVKIYLGTSVIVAMVVLMDSERMGPGEGGLVQLRLMQPVAAVPGDAFVIAPMNLNTVIAGGRILETTAEKYRKVKSCHIRPALEALSSQDIDAYLHCVFEGAQGSLFTARQLAAKTGLPSSAFERRINSAVQKGELAYFKGKGAIRTAHLDRVKRDIRTLAADAFKSEPLRNNISLSEMAERLNDEAGIDLIELAVEKLCDEKQLVRHQGGFRIPDDRAFLDANRQALIDKLLAYARESGLVPFSADTFWKLNKEACNKDEVTQLLNYLHSRKKLARLNDRRFLSFAAVEEIKGRVARTIAQSGFITVGDCKELLGYGRWGGTHVLDYLNSVGFTVRRGNRHYLKEAPGI